MKQIIDDYQALLKGLSDNDEIFDELAAVHHKFFIALLRRGFTREEAVKIMTANKLKVDVAK